MLDINTIKAPIHSWIREFSGLDIAIIKDHTGTVVDTGADIIWTEQNRPQPKYYPFGTLQMILSTDKVQQKSRIMPRSGSDGSKMHIFTLEEETLSFQIYGPGAMGYCRKLEKSIGNPSSLDKLIQKQIDTLKPLNAIVGNIYGVRIFDVGIYYTAISGDTKHSIVNQLVGLINGSDYISGGILASIDAIDADKLVIQSLPGSEFVLEYTNNMESIFHQNGFHIAINGKDGTRNMAAVSGPQSIERAGIDLFLSATFIDVDEPGIIETVELTIDNVDSNIVINP